MQILANIVTDSKQLTALAFTFVLIFAQFSIIPFLSDYMVANVGFTQEQLPFIYLIGGIASLIAAPLIGKLVDKFKPFNVFFAFAILLMIPILIITNLSQTSIYLVLIVIFFFFTFMNGRMIPAMTITTSVAPSETRGGFMSINSSVQNMSSAFAAYIAGMIIYKDSIGTIFNYHYVGYLSIALNILAIFIVMRIKSAKMN
jgi:predicted MFS family arabinose efflux permease